ncbi:ATP-grasp domain-containing protein [Streptomyces sp. NPDC019890]|uniref:ATP-grasp domain-containing protein n=1 Tax=Streptomyces sp. NPDC019890 TaxID=3365064 RepID=UPI00384D4A31
MRPPRILLLEAAGPESRALAATGAASGYQVHAATDPATHATYSAELQQVLSGCLLTDFARPDRALKDIVGYARRISADAVLTTNEYLTELLAQACASLDLPGNDPDRAAAARNKAAMSEAFARHGVTTPRTRILDDRNELLRQCEAGQITFPCVIKPADGAGSVGVTVVTNPGRAANAWRAASAPRGMYGMPLDPRVLVQDYTDGTEYSVESITQHGRTRHLCTTRKTLTSGAHRVEVGHSLPADLLPAAERAVQQEVERAIAAVGIHNGASHTEVILTDDGRCTVIEIGARLGAGHIGVLLQHALGINPWTALLDTALGRPTHLTPTRHEHATVRFLTSPRAGRLVAVTGLPSAGPGVPEVRLRTAVGETVGQAQTNRGRLGHLIVTGSDAATVERRAERLLAQIAIEVTGTPAQTALNRPPQPSRAGAREGTLHREPSAPYAKQEEHPATPTGEFDALFRGEARSGGFSRVSRIVDPALPPEIEPFSFLSTDLLNHIATALRLEEGEVLADLGCGRGGPGLWLARAAHASLVGIDFSPVAVAQARQRTAALGMAGKAHFVVNDLTATGLPDASVSAAVSIDALQYADDRAAAADEARRILRRGGRLVVTGWHPASPGDSRLPERHRHTDWPTVLCAANFTTVECHARPAWTDTYQRIYRVALQLGDPGHDAALAGLQSEARRRLPTAHLLSRIAVTAIAG